MKARSTRGNVRDPQDHPRRRCDQSRHNRQDRLYLGNLDAQSRLGPFAYEYVRGDVAHAAAGKSARRLSWSPRARQRRFARSSNGRSWTTAFELRWDGTGLDEKGYDSKTGRCLIEIDPRYFRPTEVDLLLGDPAKAKAKLGWTHETSARELAREMVREDLKTMLTEPLGKLA